jgi:hypothetical protein
VEEAFEGGQASCRAVEPIMMMFMIPICCGGTKESHENIRPIFKPLSLWNITALTVTLEV